MLNVKFNMLNMKWFHWSFVMSLLGRELHETSFTGAWILQEQGEKDIIQLRPTGSIYRTTVSKDEYVGGWSTKRGAFHFNIKDKNYFGKVSQHSLNISGTVCEGMYSPCYLTNFTLSPLFEQFHNITFKNDDNHTYLTQSNMTGMWLFENVHTNQLSIFELHENNTWNSIHTDANVFCGKWNLFNRSSDINTNRAIRLSGKKIWISVRTTDMMFIGKITRLGALLDQTAISSKINGSVVYGFEMNPEMSEGFYMTRWWQ